MCVRVYMYMNILIYVHICICIETCGVLFFLGTLSLYTPPCFDTFMNVLTIWKQ